MKRFKDFIDFQGKENALIIGIKSDYLSSSKILYNLSEVMQYFENLEQAGSWEHAPEPSFIYFYDNLSDYQIKKIALKTAQYAVLKANQNDYIRFLEPDEAQKKGNWSYYNNKFYEVVEPCFIENTADELKEFYKSFNFRYNPKKLDYFKSQVTPKLFDKTILKLENLRKFKINEV